MAPSVNAVAMALRAEGKKREQRQEEGEEEEKERRQKKVLTRWRRRWRFL